MLQLTMPQQACRILLNTLLKGERCYIPTCIRYRFMLALLERDAAWLSLLAAAAAVCHVLIVLISTRNAN